MYKDPRLNCLRCYASSHPTSECPVPLPTTILKPEQEVPKPSSNRTRDNPNPNSLALPSRRNQGSNTNRAVSLKKSYNRHSYSRRHQFHPIPSAPDQEGFIPVRHRHRHQGSRSRSQASAAPASSSHYWAHRAAQERRRELDNCPLESYDLSLYSLEPARIIDEGSQERSYSNIYLTQLPQPPSTLANRISSPDHMSDHTTLPPPPILLPHHTPVRLSDFPAAPKAVATASPSLPPPQSPLNILDARVILDSSIQSPAHILPAAVSPSLSIQLPVNTQSLPSDHHVPPIPNPAPEAGGASFSQGQAIDSILHLHQYSTDQLPKHSSRDQTLGPLSL